MSPTAELEPATPAAPATEPRAAVGTVLVFVAVTLVVGAFAVHRLRNSPYPLDVRAAWTGASSIASLTGRAAAGSWLVLAVALAALTRWLRRRVADLTPGEAAAGATVLFWSFCYLTLLALGPLGLYRPLVLRALLVALVLAALRAARRPEHAPAPTPPADRDRAGAWIAAGAFALSFAPLLLMQLGSAVSPFMDVLPYVASTQKIVTFRFYDPFGNDAAGLWPPSRQVPGCDGPFSLLALVTGVPAWLGITSLMVPLAALQILGVYLVAREVQGGLSGGMAALFLLQTFTWRRTPDARGTAIAFPLVAIGIVFLLGRRRSPARAALGALALGLAVTVNPLIGGVGMQLAAAGTLVEAVDFRRGLITRVFALAAASLVALPEVLISLQLVVPPSLVAAAAVTGVLALAALARRSPAGEPARRALPLTRAALMVSLPAMVLWRHAQIGSEFFTNEWFGYALLLLLAAGGLAVAAHAVWEEPGRWPAAALPALALWIGLVDFNIADPLRFTGALETRSLASEVTPKMVVYWWPYWLVILAGGLFGTLARRVAVAPALAFALLIVIYPLRHVEHELDYDGDQLSLAETWGFHLTNAARGYWSGRGDRRFVIDGNWRAVTDALLAEVAAGRITYDTHVMHISPSIDSVEAALVTGVSVDLVTPRFDPRSGWTVGGRARGFDALPAAFAARPRYVITEHYRPTEFPELAAYDEMVARDYVRLYRLRGEGALGSPSPLAATATPASP